MDLRPGIRNVLLQVAIEFGVLASREVADRHVLLPRAGFAAIKRCFNAADPDIEEGVRQSLHGRCQPLDGGRVGKFGRKPRASILSKAGAGAEKERKQDLAHAGSLPL